MIAFLKRLLGVVLMIAIVIWVPVLAVCEFFRWLVTGNKEGSSYILDFGTWIEETLLDS